MYVIRVQIDIGDIRYITASGDYTEWRELAGVWNHRQIDKAIELFSDHFPSGWRVYSEFACQIEEQIETLCTL